MRADFFIHPIVSVRKERISHVSSTFSSVSTVYLRLLPSCVQKRTVSPSYSPPSGWNMPGPQSLVKL